MHRLALGLSLFLLVLHQPATAQTTFGAITGTVHDSTGAVAPGVSIEAVHVESGYRYATVSNETGNYTLPQLREGAYVLRAMLQGFREFVAKDLAQKISRRATSHARANDRDSWRPSRVIVAHDLLCSRSMITSIETATGAN